MSGSFKKGRRYETSALIEDQYEPGSRGRVLRNLIGINKKREMNRVEMREQLRAMDELFDSYDRGHRFTADDIRKIQRVCLAQSTPGQGSTGRLTSRSVTLPLPLLLTSPDSWMISGGIS